MTPLDVIAIWFALGVATLGLILGLYKVTFFNGYAMLLCVATWPVYLIIVILIEVLENPKHRWEE